MKISVLIPVYNTEQYLPRCINSVLNQSFADFELLLIDDGSTDGSGEICDAYAEKDNRVVVFHKENGGASSARNVGLDNAKGEWITFVDSDDWIEDEYFNSVSDADVDLVARNWFYADGSTKEWLKPVIAYEDCFRDFLQNNIRSDVFRTVAESFFKRSIINDNRIRFDDKFRLGEDTLFCMDYYAYCKSAMILDGARYIYNRQDEWNKKYGLTWKEANNYLSIFMNKYEALPIESQPLLDFMFSFIRRQISINESNVDKKWSLSKPVLKYKKTKLSERGLKFKFNYYVSMVLSFIIHV